MEKILEQIIEQVIEHPRTPLAEPSFEAGGFADHNTPLVRNCWYVAALSSEVSRDIMSRRLLGVDVALYRTMAGEPVAVRNRCPHRSFPLAKGRLEGDTLICGYHGMQFDSSGRCVNMPSMPIVPTNAQVRSFDVVERAPLIWIWMGDADKADEALIPDTHWLNDPGWKSVGGQFYMKSDYVSMHENLLDQTHFPFLHPGAIGTPEYARSKLKIRRDGEVVIIDRMLKNSPPPGVYAVPTGLTGKPVDRYSEARFQSPALHTAFAKIVDPTPPPGAIAEYRFNITHIFTAETNGSIHYWWFNSRDFDLGNKASDEYLHAASAKAYLEDVDALEWILDVVRKDTEQQFDLNFAPDKPGLLMRRALYDRAAAEAGYVL
ncbi:aromatic ring-hydroxylating dioxygenase subunit alpha [Variovorax sp. J22R133]|uniref:aromatic ring-hydroxylating dioxygenase subunit alpha n=1 Tax=Variovorax brevis TaxID=3053503 RepID=UPI002574E76B|nr:aromatic ring-hydroxylating dioxygenase subunit alpha [Variovorax sp. J22R133]MDM0116076.1 aromatic ring-hydroxylating dioxygenase subunit alpha [Variovorax sp. J22R133]